MSHYEHHTMIRVLIAASDPDQRRRLWVSLALETDIWLIGEASNGAHAIELAHVLRPAVAVIDFSLSGVDGITTTAILRPLASGTQVILLSNDNNADMRDRAYAAGVFRILDSGSYGATLLVTIRQAAEYRER
jgi:DNA-binding NarL/FixJ family response regulator